MGILEKIGIRKKKEELPPQEQERVEKFEQKFSKEGRGTRFVKRIVSRYGKPVITKQVPYYTKEGKKYYRTVVRGRQPVPVRYAQAVAGRRLPLKYQGKKGYAGRGRPKGPPGKYIIPGKGAVGVYEYRKWARYQKRLIDMQQQQKMAEIMAKNPQMAQYYAQTGQIPEQAIQAVQQPQISQLQPRRQTISPQPIQQQPPQIDTQQSGVQMVGDWGMLGWKLPSFSMKNQAPQQNVPIPMKVFQVEAPVTNPQGDWYTQTDFMTGKQVLRKRFTGGFGLW